MLRLACYVLRVVCVLRKKALAPSFVLTVARDQARRATRRQADERTSGRADERAESRVRHGYVVDHTCGRANFLAPEVFPIDTRCVLIAFLAGLTRQKGMHAMTRSDLVLV